MSIQYEVLWSPSSADHLQNLVNAALRNGWELQGGVSVSSGNMSATALFAQAVVKKS